MNFELKVYCVRMPDTVSGKSSLVSLMQYVLPDRLNDRNPLLRLQQVNLQFFLICLHLIVI